MGAHTSAEELPTASDAPAPTPVPQCAAGASPITTIPGAGAVTEGSGRGAAWAKVRCGSWTTHNIQYSTTRMHEYQRLTSGEMGRVQARAGDLNSWPGSGRGHRHPPRRQADNGQETLFRKPQYGAQSSDETVCTEHSSVDGRLAAGAAKEEKGEIRHAQPREWLHREAQSLKRHTTHTGKRAGTVTVHSSDTANTRHPPRDRDKPTTFGVTSAPATARHFTTAAQSGACASDDIVNPAAPLASIDHTCPTVLVQNPTRRCHHVHGITRQLCAHDQRPRRCENDDLL